MDGIIIPSSNYALNTSKFLQKGHFFYKVFKADVIFWLKRGQTLDHWHPKSSQNNAANLRSVSQPKKSGFKSSGIKKPFFLSIMIMGTSSNVSKFDIELSFKLFTNLKKNQNSNKHQLLLLLYNQRVQKDFFFINIIPRAAHMIGKFYSSKQFFHLQVLPT